MRLIYIKNFKARKEIPTKLEEGRVYKAFVDNGMFVVENDGVSIYVKLPVTDAEGYYCEAEEITKDNYVGFDVQDDEDFNLVTSTFVKTTEDLVNHINSSLDVMKDERSKKIATIYQNLQELEDTDYGLFEAIGDGVSHILDTFKDKYEASAVPEIDLYGLMRHSPGSKYFNLGNASKYVKRYLTVGYDKSGNIKDLHKALHYLLMELDSINNRADDIQEG